ncbi:hypothetical protein [Streptomyces californicus]|uniref:hypothetical protein n=1 Tax=Streptomyces californicus TaxID=67351 RepID=UPI0036C13C09
MSPAKHRLPPAVTFQSGAQLLVELGIVDHITHQGIRHIAKSHPDWPFGPDKGFPYWDLANAVVMETEPFIAFFREHPRASGGES